VSNLAFEASVDMPPVLAAFARVPALRFSDCALLLPACLFPNLVPQGQQDLLSENRLGAVLLHRLLLGPKTSFFPAFSRPPLF